MNTGKPACRLGAKLALLFVLSAFARFASACSCSPISTEQLLESSALVFRGTVTGIEATGTVARFSVSQQYKGMPVGDTVAIVFGSGRRDTCSTTFRVGQMEIVFAHRWRDKDGHDVFATGMCSLRSPREPQPALDTYAAKVDAAKGLVEQSPVSAQRWDSLANVYELAKDHASALDALQHLRALSGDAVNTLVRIGEAEMALERLEQALSSFQSALVKDPAYDAARRGRNQALLKLRLSKELPSGERDFAGMLMGAPNFSGKNMAGADFSKARMGGARFESADLSGALFVGSDVYKVNFKGADLRGSNWMGVRTYESNFTDADLTAANLTDADLRLGNFSGANLTGARLTGAKAESAVFSKAVLRGAIFARAYLHGADFTDVDLSGQDLSGLEMQGARFTNAKLVNANLAGAYFAGPTLPHRGNEALHGPGRSADFRGADLTGARLDGADLRYALFDCNTRWPAGFQPAIHPLLPVSSRACPVPFRTTLFTDPPVLREVEGRIGGERAEVRGPKMEGLDFTGINLAGAHLSGFSFWRVKFIGAVLVGTDLRNASLQGSDFSDADLRQADASGANFWGAKLTGAKLDGAKLQGAWYSAQTVWPAGFDPAKAGALLQ